MRPAAVISPFSRSAEAEEALARGRASMCLLATTPEHLALHHEIRRRVFVEEQGFFEGSDRDARDEDPETLRVLGLCGRVAGGAVRLYPLEERGEWKGDRLAVLPPFRPRGLGVRLVRFAVRSAAERAGRRMVAHIQVRNVPFFERLGWHTLGDPVEFVGRTHQVMGIDLPAAPRS